MKYGDLIQFDPIESVIQLNDVADPPKARQFVKDYVISDDLADRLINLVVPQLQFDEPADNKGLMIIGNYGTGKSHLLAVISSISENEDLLQNLSHPNVSKGFKKIAGRFKVIRSEIGAIKMPLREFVVTKLEEGLKEFGIDFSFPRWEDVTSNKSAFEDMMEKFGQRFPDKGLLFIVDELLDYLRSRKDQEFILDINFLREIGEVCKNLRFRFIAGVQETIFDNPRFAFVATSLMRVKDRFDQIMIARNDVKYVVSQRLLKKSGDQQAKIRHHLEPYTRFYGDMNEKMDEYVRLFPVHPDYIDTFERVTIVEKREILKTLSLFMKVKLNDKVPEDYPGLIAFDSYWNILIENPGFRAIPDVREVMKCTEVLVSRLNNSFPRKQYLPMALRIVEALSLHRLTTGDIDRPIGMTSEELRDRLCLYDPLVPEMEGDEPEKDLQTHVETVLKEIVKTVSGQFISYNPENGQYYLDLKKTEDYDTIIEKRSKSLEDDVLDNYYYEALKIVMECQDTTSFTGYRIWEHEVIWHERNISRNGYLFFGAPNERSTAVPQRDFYIYFIQPFSPPRFKDEKLPDEVFCFLKGIDDEFTQSLQRYASANELSLTSSGQKKQRFQEKAEYHRKKVILWLRNKMINGYEITYQGRTKQLGNWANESPKSIRELSRISPNETINFKDMIDTISAVCLAPHFSNQAPEYPSFSVVLKNKNIPQAVQETIRALAGQHLTKQSVAILHALELIEQANANGDIKITPSTSRYAQYILDLFKPKGHGQVVNRNEIIKQYHKEIEYMNPDAFRLEPEWVFVILAALIYSGDIVVTITGRKYDASSIQHYATLSIEELRTFKHIELPKDFNRPALKALFDLLKQPTGMVKEISQSKEGPVQILQQEIESVIKQIIKTQQIIREGLSLWEFNLLSLLNNYSGQDHLDDAKVFFESLQVYTTPGRFKNFKYSEQEIRKHTPVIDLLTDIEYLRQLALDFSQIVIWLSGAVNTLHPDHQWIEEFRKSREKFLKQLKDNDLSMIKIMSRDMLGKFQKLKQRYITLYLELHTKARLDRKHDKLKESLLKDVRFTTLRRLADIDMLPRQELNQIQNQLAGVKTCFSLTEKDLAVNPYCPHCLFKPITEISLIDSSFIVQQMDEQLDKTIQSWKEALLKYLKDPSIVDHMELIKAEERNILEEFINSQELTIPVEEEFIHALKEVFSGLEKVTISISDICNQLYEKGNALTPEEVKRKFDDFITKLIKGKDPAKVRIIIEGINFER